MSVHVHSSAFTGTRKKQSKCHSGLTPKVSGLAQPFAILSGLSPKVLSSDPHDDFLLALAEAASADYLVTGDKSGLLALRKHRRTRIVTARRFSKMLGD